MSRVREYRSEEPIRPSPSFLLAPLDYLTPHSVSELIKSYFSDFNMEEDHHKQQHRHLQQEASNQFLTEEQAREQGTSEEGQDKDKEQVEEEEEKGEEEEEDEESVLVVVDDPATPPTLVVPETLSTALVELGDEKKREVRSFKRMNAKIYPLPSLSLCFSLSLSPSLSVYGGLSEEDWSLFSARAAHSWSDIPPAL